MSCPICHRSSCAIIFHPMDEIQRYEARKEMSDDVDTLRRKLQDALEEIEELRRAPAPDAAE